MTLGRAYALLLQCRHGQWSLDQQGDRRAAAAAGRFARRALDSLRAPDPSAEALANDVPLGA